MSLTIAICSALGAALLLWFASCRLPKWLREGITAIGLIATLFAVWGILEANHPTANFGASREQKHSSKGDLPAVGQFVVDRATGKIDGVVKDARYVVTSPVGKPRHEVQIRFNEGYSPWFSTEAAYERWEFVAERGYRENSPQVLGAASLPAEPSSVQPGQTVYNKDVGNYAGKILDRHEIRGVFVEWSNGKREWLDPADLESKWTIR